MHKWSQCNAMRCHSDLCALTGKLHLLASLSFHFFSPTNAVTQSPALSSSTRTYWSEARERTQRRGERKRKTRSLTGHRSYSRSLQPFSLVSCTLNVFVSRRPVLYFLLLPLFACVCVCLLLPLLLIVFFSSIQCHSHLSLCPQVSCCIRSTGNSPASSDAYDVTKLSSYWVNSFPASIASLDCYLCPSLVINKLGEAQCLIFALLKQLVHPLNCSSSHTLLRLVISKLLHIFFFSTFRSRILDEWKISFQFTWETRKYLDKSPNSLAIYFRLPHLNVRHQAKVCRFTQPFN